MVATIQVTPYIYVQGLIARTFPNGSVAIRDGSSEYIGMPLRRSLSHNGLAVVDREAAV
jgi:hypothetical protein